MASRKRMVRKARGLRKQLLYAEGRAAQLRARYASTSVPIRAEITEERLRSLSVGHAKVLKRYTQVMAKLYGEDPAAWPDEIS